MKKLEIGIFIAIIIGLVLKLLHLPGTGILLVILLSTLSIFYLGGSWYLFKQEKQNLPISIITGLVFSIAMVGILFKIQIWPGAKGMLSIANIGIIIMFLTSGLLYSLTKDIDMKQYYKTMLMRLLMITVLTGSLYFLPTRELIKISHRDDPEYARLLIQAHENPENIEDQKALEEYQQKKLGQNNSQK